MRRRQSAREPDWDCERWRSGIGSSPVNVGRAARRGLHGEVSWDGPSYRAGLVGYSDDSEREAVENLVGMLREFGVAGFVRVCPPFEPVPTTLAEWRARHYEDEDVEDREVA